MRGWFQRSPKSPFPDDMLKRLDRLGRSKIDIMNSGVDWDEVIKNCIAPFYDQAVADPCKFLSDIRQVIEHDTGGFATYGASCLVFELIPDSLRTEAGTALVDGGIEFKLKRGLGLASFTGYETDRYFEKTSRQP